MPSSSSSAGSCNASAGLIPVDSERGELIYIPPLHAHSGTQFRKDILIVTPKFTFYVSSSANLFRAQQCESTAHLMLYVQPVNDPPIAIPVSEMVLCKSIRTKIIPAMFLQGIDADLEDTIQVVQITHLPTHGHVHLTIWHFCCDKLPHAIPLANLPNHTVLVNKVDNGGILVHYEWCTSTSSSRSQNGHYSPFVSNWPIVQGDGIRVHNYFWFRVQDSMGAWSTKECVALRIVLALTGSAVVAKPELPPTVPSGEGLSQRNNNSLEAEAVKLQWYGQDGSAFNCRIGFYIESVPDSRLGRLVQAVGEKTISELTLGSL